MIVTVTIEGDPSNKYLGTDDILSRGDWLFYAYFREAYWPRFILIGRLDLLLFHLYASDGSRV